MPEISNLTAFDAVTADKTVDLLAIVNVGAATPAMQTQKPTIEEFQETYLPRLIGTLVAIDGTLRQVSDGDAIPNSSQLYLATDKTAVAGPLSVGQSTAPFGVLDVLGTGSTSATTSIFVNNSTGTTTMRLYDNGVLDVPQMNASSFRFRSDPTNSYITWQNGSTMDFYVAGGVFFEVRSTGVVVGGSSPAASAVLTCLSTTKGFLPPRMTTAQKNAISTPTGGLMVYDTDLDKLCMYSDAGAAWETITSA